jgi:hypothetical protein
MVKAQEKEEISENSNDKLRIFASQLNSVQLNIVTWLDVAGATRDNTLNGHLYMVDNSLGSEFQGTPHLQTICKPGQALNWIIYPMDRNKRPDGTWPPMPKINNIVFLDKNGQDVGTLKVCMDLKVFGGPDKMRSKWTSIYYYWAAIVSPALAPGVYNYRFVIELETSTDPIYLDHDGPSIRVVPVVDPKKK